MILPFLRFGLLSAALTAIKLDVRQPWVAPTFRYAELLDHWAMADVFLLGAAVGYGRVVSLIPVRIDVGGYCFIGAAFMTMLTRACLDRRAVWRCIAGPAHSAAPDAIGCTECDLVLPGSMVGERCPRCTARLHRRKPFSIPYTVALVVAAWALLPVSNYFPMSALYKTGTAHPHTIIAGVMLLFQNGFAPLGVLILCVSIGIPVFKLCSLTWFLISVWHRSANRLKRKTRVYRIVHEIGRWSNMDPFTIVIFTPMVQFGQLAHIDVGGGSIAFLAVVVISMIAARTFDPRLIWDAAEHARPAALDRGSPRGQNSLVPVASGSTQA